MRSTSSDNDGSGDETSPTAAAPPTMGSRPGVSSAAVLPTGMSSTNSYFWADLGLARGRVTRSASLYRITKLRERSKAGEERGAGGGTDKVRWDMGAGVHPSLYSCLHPGSKEGER